MRLLISVVLSVFVAAQASTPIAKELPLWESGGGVFGMSLPDYRGSDQSRGYVLPFPYLRYRGELLRMDDRRGLAALRLFDTQRTELDLSLNASQPTSSDRNDARRGMPDLDPTVEIGPVLRLKLWENAAKKNELTLQFPLRAAFAFDGLDPNHIGFVFNPVLNWFMRDTGPGGGWRLGVQAGPIFNSERYNEYYYDVDPQYATPDRPAYEASDGYGGTQLTLNLNKRFNAIWIGTFVRAYDLHGTSFEESPLVKQSHSLLAGIGIAYVFAESKTRVEAED